MKIFKCECNTQEIYSIKVYKDEEEIIVQGCKDCVECFFSYI